MQADNVAGAKLSSASFLRFWVNYADGRISVGSGRAGHNMLYSWQDSAPRPIQHVALSSWDHHLAYRNIKVHEHLLMTRAANQRLKRAEQLHNSFGNWPETRS